jgi:hypothetical protein
MPVVGCDMDAEATAGQSCQWDTASQIGMGVAVAMVAIKSY